MFSLSARVNRALIVEVDVASEGAIWRLRGLVSLSSSEISFAPQGDSSKCVGGGQVDDGQARFWVAELAYWIGESWRLDV